MVCDGKLAEEMSLNDVIEDMKRITKSGSHQGVLSIATAEVLLPQFQRLVGLTRLRKSGADVGSLIESAGASG